MRELTNLEAKEIVGGAICFWSNIKTSYINHYKYYGNFYSLHRDYYLGALYAKKIPFKYGR